MTTLDHPEHIIHYADMTTLDANRLCAERCQWTEPGDVPLAVLLQEIYKRGREEEFTIYLADQRIDKKRMTLKGLIKRSSHRQHAIAFVRATEPST